MDSRFEEGEIETLARRNVAGVDVDLFDSNVLRWRLRGLAQINLTEDDTQVPGRVTFDAVGRRENDPVGDGGTGAELCSVGNLAARLEDQGGDRAT